MSFADDLLVILTDYSGGYRLMRARMRGYAGPARREFPSKEPSDATLRVTLSRLNKRGLVKNRQGVWKITQKGRNYLSRFLPSFRSREFLGKRPKRLVITFDIPEIHRRKRNWLRIELAGLGFERLHKSVWVGPAPLPQGFVEALHDLKLLPYIKFFEAKEAEIV